MDIRKLILDAFSSDDNSDDDTNTDIQQTSPGKYLLEKDPNGKQSITDQGKEYFSETLTVQDILDVFEDDSEDEHSSQKEKVNGQQLFTCKICNKSFTLMKGLNAHERIHTEKKLFVCKLCKEIFILQMSKCYEITSREAKQFECNSCRNLHAKKPFACNKSFEVKRSLKHHELTHTEEKQFASQHYNKPFKHSDHLKAHELTHTGEKPFACQHCNKTFGRKSHLKCHKLTQTRDVKKLLTLERNNLLTNILTKHLD